MKAIRRVTIYDVGDSHEGCSVNIHHDEYTEDHPLRGGETWDVYYGGTLIRRKSGMPYKQKNAAVKLAKSLVDGTWKG